MRETVKWLVQRIFAWRLGWQIRQKAPLPIGQGAIVVANHVSDIDPPLVVAAMEPWVHFMAKKELFRYPILGWLLRKLGAFPVDRANPGRESIRQSLKILSENKWLGIFPEGTRSKSTELLPPLNGAAFIALSAKVAIIPVGVVGAEGGIRQVFRRRRGRTRILIGEPLSYQTLLEVAGTEKDRYDRVSRRIMEEIQALLDEIRVLGEDISPK